MVCVFFFQAEDGIRDYKVTGVQTCALPISSRPTPSADDRYAGQAREARADGVGRDVAQGGEVAPVRDEAVARDGEDGEGEALDVANLGGRRERRREVRESSPYEVERLAYVNVSVRSE